MRIKVKAGSLQLVIYVSAVIAVILSVFLIYLAVFSQFKSRTESTVKAIENSNLALDYVYRNKVDYSDTIYVETHDEISKVHLGKWGVYDYYYTQGQYKSKKFEKKVLAGGKIPDQQELALYLDHEDQPLVLVGNTYIQGNAYLSSAGIKSGNISGNYYSRKQFIYGRQKKGGKLPSLTQATLNEINSFTSSAFLSEMNFDFRDSELSKVLSQSHFQNTVIIGGGESLDIYGYKLDGNIILFSKERIIIRAENSLSGIIVVAPEIVIEDNFEGNLQLISPNKINIGDNVKLQYPSAVVVNQSEIRNNENIIKVGNGSKVHGSIVYHDRDRDYQTNSNLNSKTNILIGKQAIVEGQIYCKGNLELKGQVHGSVLTSGFLVRYGGSVYLNHLFDAEINVGKCSPFFVGLPLQDSERHTIKCLN